MQRTMPTALFLAVFWCGGCSHFSEGPGPIGGAYMRPAGMVWHWWDTNLMRGPAAFTERYSDLPPHAATVRQYRWQHGAGASAAWYRQAMRDSAAMASWETPQAAPAYDSQSPHGDSYPPTPQPWPGPVDVDSDPHLPPPPTADDVYYPPAPPALPPTLPPQDSTPLILPPPHPGGLPDEESPSELTPLPTPEFNPMPNGTSVETPRIDGGDVPAPKMLSPLDAEPLPKPPASDIPSQPRLEGPTAGRERETAGLSLPRSSANRSMSLRTPVTMEPETFPIQPAAYAPTKAVADEVKQDSADGQHQYGHSRPQATTPCDATTGNDPSCTATAIPRSLRERDYRGWRDFRSPAKNR